MKDRYNLSFTKDGKDTFYGNGDMKYMMELMSDYLLVHDMYGRNEISFKIERDK